mgnify:CR=1 FL=1
MRVMVLVKANRDSEAGTMPTTAELEAMGNFNDELVNAGIMLAGEGLQPSAKGLRVRFSGDDRTVTHGPFSDPDSLVAGFWIWNVGSMDEALDWIRRAPFRSEEVELRPIFEAEDFGAEFTPELREQEERQRAEIEQQSGKAPH